MFSLRTKGRLRTVGACGLLFACCGPGLGQVGESLVGRPAPEFSLQDLHGARVDLAKYRGKVVLLNFWATWCAPCRLEMPRFMQWQSEYGAQGLQVIGISVDDTEPPARRFAEKLRVSYPIAMGNARLGERYGGVLGVPVTFLIDRTGIVRARIDGETDLNADELRVRKLLGVRQR